MSGTAYSASTTVSASRAWPVRRCPPAFELRAVSVIRCGLAEAAIATPRLKNALSRHSLRALLWSRHPWTRALCLFEFLDVSLVTPLRPHASRPLLSFGLHGVKRGRRIGPRTSLRCSPRRWHTPRIRGHRRSHERRVRGGDGGYGGGDDDKCYRAVRSPARTSEQATRSSSDRRWRGRNV